jgi:hypothetical protein
MLTNLPDFVIPDRTDLVGWQAGLPDFVIPARTDLLGLSLPVRGTGSCKVEEVSGELTSDFYLQCIFNGLFRY